MLRTAILALAVMTAGAASAVCGALGAALAAMVANLTIGVKKYRAGWEAMKPVAVEGQELKDFFLAAIRSGGG